MNFIDSYCFVFLKNNQKELCHPSMTKLVACFWQSQVWYFHHRTQRLVDKFGISVTQMEAQAQITALHPGSGSGWIIFSSQEASPDHPLLV